MGYELRGYISIPKFLVRLYKNGLCTFNITQALTVCKELIFFGNVLFCCFELLIFSFRFWLVKIFVGL